MPKDEIDFDTLRDTLADVSKSFETFKEKNDGFQAETKKGFEDVVRKEEIDRINKHLDDQQATLDAAMARLKRATMEKADGDSEDHDKIAFDWANLNAKRNGKSSIEYGAEELKGYGSAFDQYLRKKDERHLTPDESKALSVGSDPDGGFLVRPDTSGRIVTRIFDLTPMRQYANVQVIGTDALEGMHDVDEADSGWVNETETRTETGTPQLEKWRIPVHELYANPRATQKLLDDAAVDVEGWLSDKVADRFAREEGSAFVNGDGIGKPRGFLTYGAKASPQVYEIGALRRFGTGVNGGFGAAPDSGDVLIDMVENLRSFYRSNAIWAMNRFTTGEVRKLKDTDGAYLWQPGIAVGTPSTLLGYSVSTFDDMPDIANGSLSIAFGDFNSGYQIVDRQGIRVLIDPYSAKPYIQYYTTKRTGGDVVDFDAIELLSFSA